MHGVFYMKKKNGFLPFPNVLSVWIKTVCIFPKKIKSKRCFSVLLIFVEVMNSPIFCLFSFFIVIFYWNFHYFNNFFSFYINSHYTAYDISSHNSYKKNHRSLAKTHEYAKFNVTKIGKICNINSKRSLNQALAETLSAGSMV